MAIRTSGMMIELSEQRREAWGNLWAELDDARKIVANLGRDLTAFDAARAKMGNVHLAAGNAAY